MMESLTLKPETNSNEDTLHPLRFIKGGEEIQLVKSDEDFEWLKATIKVRESLSDAMNARNIAFLLGSGCSSYVENGKEYGIPTMQPLAKEFCESIETSTESQDANSIDSAALKSFGLDLCDSKYSHNLEYLMEVLYSYRTVFKNSMHQRHQSSLNKINMIISKIKLFILQSCLSEQFNKEDNPVQKSYELFYRKLIYRDKALPRPWVFTTNYDLFNERAMDRLGLPYVNGFSGTVERRFNPALFRYALAEQLDLSSRKWTAVDGLVYLCKLHGSISWIEDGLGLFPIREILPHSDVTADSLMIYPTTTKQAASFGSPYSDLFREFASQIVQEQSVLFVLGYSFGDEHINNIIFQGLTIPSFRLIIFANLESSNHVLQKLRQLEDPRIWFIGGRGPESGNSAHFFDVFVKDLMPETPSNKIEIAVKKVLANLLERIPEAIEESNIDDFR